MKDDSGLVTLHEIPIKAVNCGGIMGTHFSITVCISISAYTKSQKVLRQYRLCPSYLIYQS